MSSKTRAITISLLLSFMLLFVASNIVFQIPKVYATNPSVVVNVGTSDYSWGFMQKSFYAQGRFWQFYCSSSTKICYKSSTDGETWGSENIVRTGVGHGFSLWYDGSTYVHYVYAVPDYGEAIFYCRGTPQSGGTISWGTEYTVYSLSGWLPWQPTIAVDSNNYPYIFTSWEQGTTYCRLVIKSSNNNGVWNTASGYPMNLTISNSAMTAGEILPLLGTKMYAVYFKTEGGYEYHYGRLYNGSAWGTEGLIDETNAPEVFSAISRDDEIHMVFGYSGIKYINYTSGSWGTSETITSEAPQYLGAFGIEDATTEFYVYYTNTGYETDYSTSYYHGTSGNWVGGIDIFWDHTPRGEEFSCFRKSWGGYHSCTMPDVYGNLEFWSLSPNTNPSNDALTLDLTGANYKGTKTLLTAKQDYKFVYKASDTDGVTDITYAEIRLDYSSKNVILRATKGTGDSWTFSEQSDPSNYVSLGTCSDSTSDTQKTFNFYVKINWAWGDSAETIGVRAYVIDSQSASDQDDYSNVFGVECHLASSSLSVNDYRVNPSQTLTMSGYWYYNGTAVFPPDGDYQVKIKLSGTQKGSTDTTLVSGAFSISDVAAESTVNSYTYQVFVNYNASAGSFNAVVVDKARVYYEQLDDSRVSINVNIEFRVKIILLYDNHALGTGDTVAADFGSLTWDAGNSWFDGSRTQATVGSYVFQISSLSEATYGITSFEINVTDPTGVYDRIRIDSINVVDGRIDINTEGSFYATASLEFDSHTLGSGDALSLSGHAFTWISSRSRFEYNTTQSSVLHVIIDSFTSGNEATYGITVGNINSKSATIKWDRIQVSFITNTTGPILDEVVLFTVELTREYDSSSITSYSYNINRNGSSFGNPHSTSTFTDVQSSEIIYIYDFVSVLDNTYGLTVFIDPSSITVTWSSTNVAPTIGGFTAPANVYAGQYVFINATVEDIDGRTQIANATLQLSGNVILKWLNTFNTFSIQSDPNNYITLNESACLRTILNDTAYLLSWNLKFAWNYSYATPSIIVTNSKVYDMYSSYGSNSKSDLFAFKDDLIVATASVNPTETTPETNVVFSGTIYYYNTTLPPYITTGITVYFELDGLLQGATTTISSSGAWTKIIRCPATTGNKTYVIYSMTDEIGVANKTVNLFIMSTGPTGGGYFLPSTPIYRPENYTYTPTGYVPEEIAVPSGLEGLGLNILIIAIVGSTVLGVGASVVKPRRSTLASKMHVKRATNSDYQKRLRRPKRKVEHK